MPHPVCHSAADGKIWLQGIPCGHHVAARSTHPTRLLIELAPQPAAFRRTRSVSAGLSDRITQN